MFFCRSQSKIFNMCSFSSFDTLCTHPPTHSLTHALQAHHEAVVHSLRLAADHAAEHARLQRLERDTTHARTVDELTRLWAEQLQQKDRAVQTLRAAADAQTSKLTQEGQVRVCPPAPLVCLFFRQ